MGAPPRAEPMSLSRLHSSALLWVMLWFAVEWGPGEGGKGETGGGESGTCCTANCAVSMQPRRARHRPNPTRPTAI